MAKRITNKQREDAWQLYKDGKNIRNIAESIGISYSYTWIMTEGRKRGFKSTREYYNHLAIRNGFKNHTEYLKDLNKITGLINFSGYNKYLAKRKGFNNLHEYQKHYAQEKGFRNYSEYKRYLAQKRSKKLKNKELSDLIKNSLRKLGKSQYWLAKETGIDDKSVSNYFHGIIIPRKERLIRLFSALEIKEIPKSLDNFLEE